MTTLTVAQPSVRELFRTIAAMDLAKMAALGVSLTVQVSGEKWPRHLCRLHVTSVENNGLVHFTAHTLSAGCVRGEYVPDLCGGYLWKIDQ